jgi:DNA-binding HxlR family transcriptional regulator
MSWDEVSDSVCPIARSLAIVGDRWTMLILREFSMGVHRFDELQAHTGMSSHLLTSRLKRMEQDRIVERRLYNERPARYEYHLTQKGKELDPVLMMLRTWGRKWEGDCPHGEPAVRLVHKESGIELDDLWQIPGGGRGFTFDDVEPTVGQAFETERTRRREAFQAGKPYVPMLKLAPARIKPKASTAKAESKAPARAPRKGQSA